MSLVARQLEAAGIASVILGSALDIVEHCGVPRFLFTDFPLGNPCGKPWDLAMQHDIVGRGLDLLENATQPRTTARTPHAWGTDAWRERYMQVTEENRAQLRIAGEQRRRERQARRQANRASAG